MMSRRELLTSFAAASLFPFALGESKTMEQRISLVTLGVKDLGASKRFYADGLGWKPVYEDKEILFFQTGGMVFALFLREKLAEDFQVDPATLGGQPWLWLTMCARKAKSIPSSARRRQRGPRF
jgi:catechol 2,3-dioxygenase-like lactoylglutathione lyase family enzyme